MRYEFGLIIRVILALALFLVPSYVYGINVFQEIFEKVTFDTIYAFLEESGADPKPGSFSVDYAISILDGKATINIVKYCVTASAYYFLALLCIITMSIQLWKRILMFLIGTALIFAMNIVRIIVLISTLLNNEGVFKEAHFAWGFFLSIVYVVLIWVLLSLLFHVKTIPFLSDIKLLSKEMFNNKK
ncbi:MAG: pacearchaeosortase [Nanoarchaeota archaeon]|nr:pacearchaeosortase [Nanoarchaeota archaeon]MCG2718555.1 pacearchaeosortase [Nanoarchaeota archaeon]